ncbi:MAG: carboxylating nicotinate-nucleotide diphosphorylase [Fimbriimonadaceae bacterium]|nr:carboxylating nicotinate-nucleotide diphosphorylase [Fimbriimonadaceae bacterium]QYK57135.1 MAG: carboxylating nicotinate-nucleotide diphosphorylase [Fimbriimonadaceae bacterium]
MTGWFETPPFGWESLVERALEEDIGTGDVSAALVPKGISSNWYVEVEHTGVLCGIAIAANILSRAPGSVQVLYEDGSGVKPGQVVLRGKSKASSLLSYERVALNFLMVLSGVSSKVSEYVEAVSGTSAAILDTRKTIPGLRNLEKYAVRCGGGLNHRFGLYDAVMIKDNHIRALGSITHAVHSARSRYGPLMGVEVECTSAKEVEEAVDAGADVVMLDNMSLEAMAGLVRDFKGKCRFEASGGVSLESVAAVAGTGVDFISVGRITHSVAALSFHLEFE